MSNLELPVDPPRAAIRRRLRSTAPSTRPARPQAGSDATRWPELELLAGLGDSRQHGAYHVRRIAMPAPALGSDRCQALRDMCMRASQLAFGVDMNEYCARARHTSPRLPSGRSPTATVSSLAAWHVGLAGSVRNRALHRHARDAPSASPTGSGRFSRSRHGFVSPRKAPRCRSGLPDAEPGRDAHDRAAIDRGVPACGSPFNRTGVFPRGPGGGGRMEPQADRHAALRWDAYLPSTFPCPLCDGLHHSGDPRTDKLFEQLDLTPANADYALGWVSPRGHSRRWRAARSCGLASLSRRDGNGRSGEMRASTVPEDGPEAVLSRDFRDVDATRDANRFARYLDAVTSDCATRTGDLRHARLVPWRSRSRGRVRHRRRRAPNRRLTSYPEGT